jgi:hypothetical protein
MIIYTSYVLGRQKTTEFGFPFLTFLKTETGKWQQASPACTAIVPHSPLTSQSIDGAGNKIQMYICNRPQNLKLDIALQLSNS